VVARVLPPPTQLTIRPASSSKRHRDSIDTVRSYRIMLSAVVTTKLSRAIMNDSGDVSPTQIPAWTSSAHRRCSQFSLGAQRSW
jgi:hypothetical protein